MATGHSFRVNKQCEGIAVFFHDWPPYFVLRFPTVIESNYGGTRRYVFFASLPRKQILHRNHSDALVFQFLHLRFKRSRRNLRAWVSNLVDQPVITKNDDLSGLIDHWLLDLGSCRHHRSRRRRSCYRGSAARWLRLFRNSLLL